jgi:hypothetical protein
MSISRVKKVTEGLVYAFRWWLHGKAVGSDIAIAVAVTLSLFLITDTVRDLLLIGEAVAVRASVKVLRLWGISHGGVVVDGGIYGAESC